MKATANEREEFTIEDGKEYQAKDLKFWESILHPAVYAKLHRAVIHANANKPMETGYDVVRGGDLQNWVLNYDNEYKPF